LGNFLVLNPFGSHFLLIDLSIFNFVSKIAMYLLSENKLTNI
jgi:hypothetical protein